MVSGTVLLISGRGVTEAHWAHAPIVLVRLQAARSLKYRA